MNMNWKKYLTVASLAVLTMSSLTACVEPNTFTGKVEVVEKDYKPYRPKMGSMPVRMPSWSLDLCPVHTDPGSDSCWYERISNSEYDRINEGDTLESVNGEVTIP